MGLFHTDGTVTAPTGKQAAVKLLVDSSATYTLLPETVWQAIELEPLDSVERTFADGTEAERRVSEC